MSKPIGRQAKEIVYKSPTSRRLARGCLLLLLAAHAAAPAWAATQFTSHITVNTPARSYSHGVGAPARPHRRTHAASRTSRHPSPADNRYGSERGYPRTRPAVPFTHEEVPSGNSIGVAPWLYNDFTEVPIPVLPPSPYKVDSPDPESLWPEGLFLPPPTSPRLDNSRRSDDTADELLSAPSREDPYLVEGSEAIAAVQRASRHGIYYFHDAPHIASLLAHQELRARHDLPPLRIGSIRHSWPYNRP